MWEVGVLLAGVGFLFFSVYLAMLIKNATDTVKEINRLVIRNSREIEDLIISSSGILHSVNSLSNIVSGTKGGIMSSAVKSAMSVAQMRKNRQRGRIK